MMARLLVACVIDDDVVRSIRRGDISSTRAIYDSSVVEALRRIYGDATIVSARERGIRTLDDLRRLRPDLIFNLALSLQSNEVPFIGGLQMLGIPYTGSGPLALGLASDKVRSRHILRMSGVRVPAFVELAPGRMIPINLKPPLIVKPVSGAGCMGIYDDSVVTSLKAVPALAKRIWNRFDQSAVCEEFIVGKEFRVGLIEGHRGQFKIARVTQWRFGSARRGWGFKTEAIVSNKKVRRSRNVSRAAVTLSGKFFRELAHSARTSLKALDVRGYATVDVRFNDTIGLTVLEVNANPGLWSGSSIWGYPSFEANLKLIANAALRRSKTD
jgi:D-alanine-D-alanine ligase